ncbi:MAG: hypothetical protein IPH20_05735 [Bacteroidales bacterium]|nr:hypothetical protein [Bacteroidales bacterium]
MSDYQAWFSKTTGLKVVERLNRNSFNGLYFETAAEATDYICGQITSGMHVAFGDQ